MSKAGERVIDNDGLPSLIGLRVQVWGEREVAEPRLGDAAEAFEVIVPSLPSFEFSTPLPENPDMSFWKVADLWHTLMTRILGGVPNPQVSGRRVPALPAVRTMLASLGLPSIALGEGHHSLR